MAVLAEIFILQSVFYFITWLFGKIDYLIIESRLLDR